MSWALYMPYDLASTVLAHKCYDGDQCYIFYFPVFSVHKYAMHGLPLSLYSLILLHLLFPPGTLTVLSFVYHGPIHLNPFILLDSQIYISCSS